jgi:glycosyltransferase involved in cell wall biosynthesis
MRGRGAHATKMQPVISVIMSVHNAEGFLDASVGSILAQSFGDFEFILIDDGSTDGSREKLQAFANRDSRIRLISRPNKGLTPTLNEALKLAGGELIARMDADDIATPDRLKIQVEYMRAHPEVTLLGGAYELIDHAGRLLTTITPPADDATLQEHALSGRTPICHPLAIFRRDAAEKVGGYDEELTVAQDLDLWLKLGEVGKMSAVPDVLLKYRQHEQSVSEKKQALQVRNMKLACERAYARRGITREFLGESGWRPTSGRRSKHEYALRYGWWAFNSAQRRTAMIYGMKAIGAMPWSSAGWKLLACAAIKTPQTVR